MILPCGSAKQAVYAKGTTCETDQSQVELMPFQFITRTVSTNFDADLYNREQKMQLYSVENDSFFTPNTGDTYISQKINLNYQNVNKIFGNFFFAGRSQNATSISLNTGTMVNAPKLSVFQVYADF